MGEETKGTAVGAAVKRGTCPCVREGSNEREGKSRMVTR